MGTKKKESKTEERQFYDLKKLWLIFQESNKVTLKVKDLALNSLIEILQECEKDVKDVFIGESLENIKNLNSFYSTLIFLRKIINTFPLDS